MGYLSKSLQPVVRIDYFINTTATVPAGQELKSPSTSQQFNALQRIGLALFPENQVYSLDYKFNTLIPGIYNTSTASDLVTKAWSVLRPGQRVRVIVVDPAFPGTGTTLLKYYLSLNNRLVHPSRVGPLELSKLTQWLENNGPAVERVITQQVNLPGRYPQTDANEAAIKLTLEQALQEEYPGRSNLPCLIRVLPKLP